MVEFAIALPILLLLLYGILEVGRLLFLYSTVVTASRQAARYGATTGEDAAGTVRYNDCDGIRNAANQVGYLGDFDTIDIQLDRGPDDPDPTFPITYCSTGTSQDNLSLTGNENRIIVTVEDQFVPLLTLVPLDPRTISATSSRTIITGVPIVVDVPPGDVIQYPTTTTIYDMPDPSLPGQNINIVITVTDNNDPTNIPTGTVIINLGDPANTTCVITLVNGAGSCPAPIAYPNSATPGTTYTITAEYGGDETHLTSGASGPHTINKANTITTITADSPDP